MKKSSQKNTVSVSDTAIGSVFRRIIPSLAIISGMVNLLALTGSIYMLQVYDRVLSSRSVPTLVALSLLVFGLYLVQGMLEVVRSQVLGRVASKVDQQLTPLALRLVTRITGSADPSDQGVQPVREVDTIRTFMAGQGPVAFFDLPWMPIYLLFVFVLHPTLGWLTVAGACVLIVLTLMTERAVRGPNKDLAESGRERYMLAAASHRNAEVLRAMGFGGRFRDLYEAANGRFLSTQETLNDKSSNFTIASKVFRMLLQSALLGVGAFLAIKGELTAGAIIAGSIVASRALSPIEIAIGQWRGFVAARQAFSRLKQMVEKLPADVEPLQLPAPKASLAVENIAVYAPGSGRPVLNNVSFKVDAGKVAALIGPSAAGKSTLARAITGVWPLSRGSVRLDGAELARWRNEEIGQHIGYLPQDVELFDGTITQNISRFAADPDPAKVLAAATAAQVHEMILRLPNGFETRVGANGSALSAGQRQRIGLARALYGEPFLVVLDEPNSNLDADGEAALLVALNSIKRRQGLAIVVSHRPGVLQAADFVGVVGGGQLNAFGPRDEVLRKVLKNSAAGSAAPVTAPSFSVGGAD